jgi:hypothetical protein
MKLYVLQDGADFYHYSDRRGLEPVRIVTAPFKVPDFDLEKAMEARKWHDEYG